MEREYIKHILNWRDVLITAIQLIWIHQTIQLVVFEFTRVTWFKRRIKSTFIFIDSLSRDLLPRLLRLVQQLVRHEVVDTFITGLHDKRVSLIIEPHHVVPHDTVMLDQFLRRRPRFLLIRRLPRFPVPIRVDLFAHLSDLSIDELLGIIISLGFPTFFLASLVVQCCEKVVRVFFVLLTRRTLSHHERNLPRLAIVTVTD